MLRARAMAEEAGGKTRFRYELLVDLVVLAACFGFIGSYLPPSLLLLDTTPTGGDIPAHNYLVSHLQQTIKRGTILGWAGGWWSGFPMFQYYFFLPYLVIALLGFVIPVNIAFKIVSVSGVYLLPLAMYVAARQMRLGRTGPVIFAVLSLPFLFVQSHSIWGVNVRSTLAGMISNSVSFCLFVLFLGFALRDMEEKRSRPSTALLLTLCFYSHFFTTLIGIMVVSGCVLLYGRGFLGRARVLLPTGVIGVLCAAFWLFPLMLKGAYSVEFGGDWDEKLLKTFPQWVVYASPLALGGMGLGAWKRRPVAGMLGILLSISVLMWYFGGRLNSSFGNIRFWPFIFFAFVAFCGLGLTILLEPLRYGHLAALGVAAIVLALLSLEGEDVSQWFKWNMDGVEGKKPYPTLARIMGDLRGTPGRFVTDQDGSNNRFGSDRVFEAMPAMIGKPFVVGGIVNSATGALFGYTVQCEISKSCAGFPKLTKAPEFNVDAALRHMDLFSVSHIVGLYPKLLKEMEGREDWPLVDRVGEFRVYARRGGPAPYVFVPDHHPAVLATDRWKERAIEWFSVPALLDRPIVYVAAGEKPVDEEISLEVDLGAYFGLLTEERQDPTEIPCWSLLGPFYHDPELGDPYHWNPVGRGERKLQPGSRVRGKTWESFVRQGKVDVDTMVNPSHHFVVYAFAGLYCDRQQDAELLLANDDEISVFVNGRRVKNAPRAEVESPTHVPVTLMAGRSDLLIKLNQGVGGAFYHARVQTPDGKPVPGLRFGPDANGPAAPESVAFRPARRDCNVEVTRFDDEEVTFRTDCVGEPHIIKYSYFPNWKVDGARKVYQVSPNFMLVYPRRNEVRLYYGSLPVDTVSRVLTVVGYLSLAASFWIHRRGTKGPRARGRHSRGSRDPASVDGTAA